jgi:hypothetical protein
MSIPEDLEVLIDKARKTVKTDSYPMSIGELVGMYERDEIVLRPEYQRYFRWTNEQKLKANRVNLDRIATSFRLCRTG